MPEDGLAGEGVVVADEVDGLGGGDPGLGDAGAGPWERGLVIR